MKGRVPAARCMPLAFTLIEMLVVIAIIGILASLLLPALSSAKTNTMKQLSRTEEGSLVSAIQQYYAQYSRLPASGSAVAAANSATNYGSFVFGTASNTVNGSGSMFQAPYNLPTNVFPSISEGGESSGQNYQNYNSEVIAILRDDNFFPETSNNIPHMFNPGQASLFHAKISTTNSGPGIGTDDVFRDPWGDPYIISMDLGYTGKTFDPYLNQMYQAEGTTNLLFVPSEAIVWSCGPAKSIQLGSPLRTGGNNKFNQLTITTSEGGIP